ncbi:MAG: GNAT family N-acetyltransferase [Chloroflexi bacterium]|nr:GNAT family N-acetyltransferase [Chloroflexota bacterium]
MRAAFDANFPGLIEDERYDVLVAGRDGQLARYLLVSDSLTLFANGVVTRLLELYVNEEDRGRGIGRELVDQAVSRARDRGAVEVTVPTRRARSFYLAMGFEPPAEFFKLSLKI